MVKRHVRSPFLRLDVVSSDQPAASTATKRKEAGALDRGQNQLQPVRNHLISRPFKQYQVENTSNETPRIARKAAPNSFVVLQEATNAERRKQLNTAEEVPQSLLDTTISSFHSLHKALRVKGISKNEDAVRRRTALMDRLIITPRAIVTNEYADLDYLHVDVRLAKQRETASHWPPSDANALYNDRRENDDRKSGDIRSLVCKPGRLLPYRPVNLRGPQIRECFGILPESEFTALAKSRTLKRRVAELARLHEYESIPARHQSAVSGGHSVDNETASRTMRILEHLRRSAQSNTTRVRARPRSATRTTLMEDSVSYYYDAKISQSTTARSSTKASDDAMLTGNAVPYQTARSSNLTRVRSAGSMSSSSIAAYTVHVDQAGNNLSVRQHSHRASLVSTPASLTRAPGNTSVEANEAQQEVALRSSLSNQSSSRLTSADGRRRVGSAASARRSMASVSFASGKDVISSALNAEVSSNVDQADAVADAEADAEVEAEIAVEADAETETEARRSQVRFVEP